MAASDYVQLAALKLSLGITGSTYDTDLQLAITAASRAIDELGGPGRRFYADVADVTRKFLPENSGYCIIDDLSSLTSLAFQSDTWTLDQDFYLEPLNASSDARPSTAVRTIARPFIFSKAEQPPGWTGFDARITVVGKWGWTSTPEPIQEAASILATRLFKRVREAPFGVIGMGTDAQVVELGSVDPDVLELVEPYSRNVLIA
jgi:hypothetical protein